MIWRKREIQGEEQMSNPMTKKEFEEFSKNFSEYEASKESVRPWVGLTDKEIEAIWEVAMFTNYGVGAELSNQPFVHYARAIEAKLKEKNT
jgi:hypothetical protein